MGRPVGNGGEELDCPRKFGCYQELKRDREGRETWVALRIAGTAPTAGNGKGGMDRGTPGEADVKGNTTRRSYHPLHVI